MQRIYEPENLMEGELLQQMLASEGIEAHLVGRHLLGGTGELPIFGLLGLEVDNDQAAYARELSINHARLGDLALRQHHDHLHPGGRAVRGQRRRCVARRSASHRLDRRALGDHLFDL